jgi:1-acyl-sn-glycerol-3-phosphate acyltransferase
VLWALGGWRFEGRLPDVGRLVIIVAPHTSSWDFVIGIAAKIALGIRIRFLGKHTLFRPPLGWLMRALGGIPVRRETSTETVQRVVDQFAAADRMILALSPEGTRRKVERWRSGFWHIAHGAGVPILPVGLDFATRSIRIGEPVDPGDDLDAAVVRLKAWYHGIEGRHPRKA